MTYFPRSLAVLGISVTLLASVNAAATQTMDVNISLTINADVQVVWLPAGDTQPVPWAIGTASLSSTYETYTPTVGTGGSFANSHASGSNELKIQNNSNTNVAIAAAILPSGDGHTTTSWTGNNSAAVNQFNLKVKASPADAADINTTGSTLLWDGTTGTTVSNLIPALANGSGAATTVHMQLKTPTSITVGAGTAQWIVVGFTASVAP